MKTITLNCDECGNPFERPLKEVKRNKKKGRKVFCGYACGSKARNRARGSQCWHEGLLSKNDEFSPFRYFMYRAEHANHTSKFGETNLSLEFLLGLWKKQDGRCAYTGIKMELPENTRSANSKSNSPIRASLDRIDSSKGYIQGNVEFVCYSTNLAKNGFSPEQMKNFIDLIRKAGSIQT